MPWCIAYGCDSTTHKQWRSQGRARQQAQALPNACCALPPRLQKDRDTLIEQSNILLKQSVG